MWQGWLSDQRSHFGFTRGTPETGSPPLSRGGRNDRCGRKGPFIVSELFRIGQSSPNLFNYFGDRRNMRRLGLYFYEATSS